MYRKILNVLAIILASSCSMPNRNDKTETAQDRPPVKCMENSPERRGEEGCTILANRLLVGSPSGELFWHIDRYESLADAQDASGPNGVAAEAHGSFWLLTVESRTDHHEEGPNHVAWIGPIVLPEANGYRMRVQSSILTPGSATPAHQHSGPEVIYIVDGEQCMETGHSGEHLEAGQSLIIPAGGVHRGTVPGTDLRRALALILYDADRPASSDLSNPPALVNCK